jgi:hypothetical protein
MKSVTFATLSALLLVARVGSGCGGTTRAAGGSDGGSTAGVDAASAIDAQSQVQPDTGLSLGADAAEAADAQGDGEGAPADGGSCMILDGGHATCGGPWRCCREGVVYVEVVCVPLDAGCPGSPP